MIAAVIPVHNEESLLPACLRALQSAMNDPALGGESVLPVVVLDNCSDESAAIARQHGMTTISTDARSVGAARALGAAAALAAGARWLAFTDGDSEVPADWFPRQLAHRTDAVCGTVKVADWSGHLQFSKWI